MSTAVAGRLHAAGTTKRKQCLLALLLGMSVLVLLSAPTPAPVKIVRIVRGTPEQEIARFTAEVAAEPDEWRHGLMERPSLAPDAGMLFLFPEAAPRAFWMMNTLIHLDILFADASGRILNIHADVPPCAAPRRCPTYPSVAPAQYVLEIAGGRAQALGIRVGDRLQF
jgi:uncharacterized membrane protein (UPF0127 family)